MMTNFKLLSSILFSIALLTISACEKEEQSAPAATVSDAPTTVSTRSTNAITYAVTLYQAGVPAEIYALDACTGDVSPNHPPVIVTAHNGVPLENVTGIEWMQGVVGYKDESFFVVSLGDNRATGLPAIYSNTIWEIDIHSGMLVNLFLTPPNPLMDLAWGDFAFNYSYFVGFIGVESTPVNGQHYLGFYQGTNYSNLTYVSLPIDGIPANQEVQGLTWVRDIASGCPPPVDALGTGSSVSLQLSTYDPTFQEYYIYSIAFKNGAGGVQVEGFQSDVIPAPGLATHCALGWISDEQTGLGTGTMLSGGNIHQLPTPSTYFGFFDHCNPFVHQGTPSPNPVRVEVADFVGIPYQMW